MTGAHYDLHKFVSLIEKGVPDGTILDEKGIDKSDNLPFPEYKDYDHLKDLLRKGKRDEAKSFIEKGCPLNKDCADNTYDGTPLHLAISLEYPDIVELLLEKGASVDSINDSDETPLILAAIVGNVQIIDMILSKTEPKNHSNNEDLSHLHIASMRNHVNLVQKLLASGGNINKSVGEKSMFWAGFTPLHFAVEFKCVETAKFLIDKGADITIQDSRGLTPLHLAFRKKNRLLTELLLSEQYYYANNPVDADGLSHFHIACALNKKEIVEDFLHKKIDIKHKIPGHFRSWYDYDSYQFTIQNQCIDVLEYLLKCDTDGSDKTRIIDIAYTTRNLKIVNLIISSIEKAIVNAHCSHVPVNSLNEEEIQVFTTTQKSKSAKNKFCDIQRFSASEYSELHLAVLQKNTDQVGSLLDASHPSIITLTDARGKTPLHLAFETNQRDLVDQLLPLHLELDQNPTDGNNLSHFHISCTTNNLSIIEDFIKKGVDINMPINTDSLVWGGNTPLHLAIIHRNNSEVVELLLNSGADFTLKNALGLSSYDLAIPHLHSELIIDQDDEDYRVWEWVEQILLANENLKFDNFDNRGITLLHIGCANGEIDMINHYLSADAINKSTDQNLPYWGGFTPLHFAAYFENRNAMELLLDKGADPAIQDSCKNTAAHFLSSDIDERMLLIQKIVYNDVGKSIFHVACECGNSRGVQHFLKMGVDIHERSPHDYIVASPLREGVTPLHIAAEAGHSEVVELLLEHGADVNARDCYFNTPLHFSKNKEVLRVLLDHGADPEALNSDLNTALEMAIFYCSERGDFMKAVFESGWNVNIKSLTLKEELNSSNCLDFIRYVERLMVLGFNISEQNRHFYSSMITDNDSIRSKAFSYNAACAKELKLMKEIEIGSRTTLYDVLFKSSTEMSKYFKNETLQKIMESEQDLKKTYPIYAYLLIFQFKKGARRANLLEQGKKSLNILMNRWMDDLVFEMILQFMNDHEITFLNYAATGQNIFQ